MGATSMSLSNLLNIRATINEVTHLQMQYNTLYNNNQEKLSKQVKAEENWMKEYDKAQDCDKTADLKFPDGRVIKKDTVASDELAAEWADYKEAEYDVELSLDLADKDIEYDTFKTMYDTQLETLRAQEEAAKTLTSENAQDTGLLNAG